MPQGVPIPQPSPVRYDELSLEAKGVISFVKARFEDLHDSIDGGPHLADDSGFFGNDTYAICLALAVDRVNSLGAVQKDYSIASFPYTESHGQGAIRVATTIEVIKHFMISYTEDPESVGMGDSPHFSRRDYVSRWQTMLTALQSELADHVRVLDRSLLGSGEVSLLISTRQFPFGFAEKVRPSIPIWWRSW